MRGDVLDPLAVDVDVAAVAQRFQEFRPGERAILTGDDRFGMLRHGVLHVQLRHRSPDDRRVGPVAARAAGHDISILMILVSVQMIK